MNECTRCTAPAGDYVLCSTCGIALRIDLGDVPALIDDLNITLARWDRIGDTSIHRGGEHPLPFRPHASEALWVLHSTLTSWATELTGGTLHPRDTPTLARWLYGQLDRIRLHHDAATIADELTYAIREARRAVDRPNDHRLFLGRCGADHESKPCPEELHGLPWQHTVQCPTCGTEWGIRERREWLQRAAHDYLGTAPEIAGFLRITGVRCTPEMIRGYAARDRLPKRGTNQQGHPLYRIRDVLQAINDRYTHRKAS